MTDYAELVSYLRRSREAFAKSAADAIEQLVKERDSLELAVKDEVKAHLDAEARVAALEAGRRNMLASLKKDREQ